MSVKLRQWSSDYPAIFLLLGLLSAILPFLLISECSLGTALMCPLILIVSLFKFLKWPVCLGVGITAVIGIAGVILGASFPENHYINKVPLPVCGVTAEICVIDPLIPRRSAQWLPLPKLIEVEIRSLGLGRGAPLEKMTGKALLRVPYEWRADTERLNLIRYGAGFRVEGVMTEPEPSPFSDGFDFRQWLINRQTPRLLEAAKLERMRVFVPDWRVRLATGVLAVRDRILTRVTGSLTGETQRLTAALLFGCKQGLDSGNKRDFIRAGTIHAFAVSGLHIGMLSLLILLLLRPFPFHWRGWILSAIVLGYVMSTGFQPSAFRAWVMISLFSITYGSLRRTAGMNTLALSAVILLCVHPAWILDLGFQYSFSVTAFLILSWRPIQSWLSLMTDTVSEIPAAFQRRGTALKNALIRKVVQPLMGGTVALGASAPLMAFYNGFFIPFSLVANLVIIPAVFGIVSLGALKILVPHGICGGTADTLLTLFFAVMTSLCSAVAEMQDAWGIFGSPPVWLIGSAWLLLALFLAARNSRVSLIAAAVYCGLLFGAPLISVYAPKLPLVTLIDGGGCEWPMILRLDPESGRVLMVNTGDFSAASGAVREIYSRGFKRIDTLILIGSGKAACRGLTALLGQIPIETLICPARIPLKSTLNQFLELLEAQGTRIRRTDFEHHQYESVFSEGTARWRRGCFDFMPLDDPAYAFGLDFPPEGPLVIRTPDRKQPLSSVSFLRQTRI